MNDYRKLRNVKGAYLRLKSDLRPALAGLSRTTSLRDKSLTGFTLVELMVAVSIFAIGITGVSRSFIRIVAAMDTTDLEFKAVQFLETKINQLEEKFIQNNGSKLPGVQEEVELGARAGVYKLEIIAIDVPDELDVYPPEEEAGKMVEPEETEKPEESEMKLYKANLTLTWQQSGRERIARLETFFIEEEEKKEEVIQ
ncbi:MAG: prepilin-type N-terminal cleavage/methylation domain-containing protein [Candidatus Omnitrophota bacterium]